MKLKASPITSTYGKKPHIRKGYYPGQLLSIKPYKNPDGSLKESKFGHQLIFSFAIYKQDPETGEPKELLKYKMEDGSMESVILPSFVDFEWKDKDTGNYRTAITPNSRITKMLKALGWVFNPKGVDTDALLLNWVEINVDEFEATYKEEKYTASTIKDIAAYKGPKPSANLEKAEAKEPKTVKKQLNHAVVTKTSSEETINDKKAKLKALLDEGTLTQGGYDQAIEQLDGIKEERVV